MKNLQKKEVVFDFDFDRVSEHAQRRMIERYGESRLYLDFIKNNFSKEEAEGFLKKPETILKNETFEKWMVEDVKKGRVIAKIGSRYQVYSNGKIYIIGKNMEKNKKYDSQNWRIKTVLTPQMVLRNDSVGAEKFQEFY